MWVVGDNNGLNAYFRIAMPQKRRKNHFRGSFLFCNLHSGKRNSIVAIEKNTYFFKKTTQFTFPSFWGKSRSLYILYKENNEQKHLIFTEAFQLE